MTSPSHPPLPHGAFISPGKGGRYELPQLSGQTLLLPAELNSDKEMFIIQLGNGREKKDRFYFFSFLVEKVSAAVKHKQNKSNQGLQKNFICQVILAIFPTGLEDSIKLPSSPLSPLLFYALDADSRLV